MHDLLSIGQFAKLAETTTDTLKHYDNIGILSPAQTTEKNRRLYDLSQYYKFCTIQMLTNAGMSLSAIKELSDSDSKALMMEALIEQEKALSRKLLRLQGTIMHLDDMLILSAFDTDTSEPFLYEQPKSQNMFATYVESRPATYKEMTEHIKKHMNACEKESVYPFPLGCVIKKESPCRKKNNSLLLTSPLRTGMSDNRTLVQPAGQYAVILHKGSPDTIIDSIQCLKKYIEEQSLPTLSDTYISDYNHPFRPEENNVCFIKILVKYH